MSEIDSSSIIRPEGEVAPYCIATVVTAKAVDNLLENGTDGAYKDAHPWIIARDLLAEAQSRGQIMVLLLAVARPDGELELTHWAQITEIEAMEMHRGRWDSICRFSPIQPMHPIWQELDSVALQPTAEQLRREQEEDLQVHRYHLDAAVIRPYAICETPAFLAG